MTDSLETGRTFERGHNLSHHTREGAENEADHQLREDAEDVLSGGVRPL